MSLGQHRFAAFARARPRPSQASLRARGLSKRKSPCTVARARTRFPSAILPIILRPGVFASRQLYLSPSLCTTGKCKSLERARALFAIASTRFLSFANAFSEQDESYDRRAIVTRLTRRPRFLRNPFRRERTRESLSR